MHTTRFLAAAIILTLNSPLPAVPKAPRAERIPHKVVAPHGHTRNDPYYWLRERNNPGVLAYLEAENSYTAAALKKTEKLQKLFSRMSITPMI